MQRHRHQEFIRFLNAIEAQVPAKKIVHVILDNYAAHKHPNETWAMDFVHDQLATGRKLRVLTVVDTFSRFSPVLEPRFTFRGADVVEVLEEVGRQVGFPAAIRVDQGTEFVSRDLDLWAYQRGVVLDFSRPGKPTDNAFIEAFNGRFRAECLNTHWFLSLADAQEKMEDWRRYYNEERPHGAIGQKPPITLLDRRAREGWGGRPGPDRRPNCDVGYDYVTLTRGATALAVVASTFAVATSFPSKPPAPPRTRSRARGLGWKARSDRRPNCDVGYDYVTLTRGATALAVVASTFAVATSFSGVSLRPSTRWAACAMADVTVSRRRPMANEGFDQRILQVQAPIGSRARAHARVRVARTTPRLAPPEAVFSPHVPLRELIGECLPAQFERVRQCRTQSFCTNLSRSRCAVWKCSRGVGAALAGGAEGPDPRRKLRERREVSSCAAARVDAAAAVRVVSSSAPGMPKPNRRPTSRALITSGSRSPAAPRP